MITKNLLRSLILAILGLSGPAIALAQQSKVFVIGPLDCKPTASDRAKSSGIQSIHVNAQNILLEWGDNDLSYLFTDEGLITIAHKAKVYSVQSYDELQARNSRQADEGDKYHERTGKWLGYDREFRITNETATISGLKAHKVIETIGEKVEAEIWVSSESIPKRLREKMQSTYPEHYWKKVTFKPWVLDIIMAWGIPLKIVSPLNKEYSRFLVCESRVFEDSISDKAFQVPSGYRREK